MHLPATDSEALVNCNFKKVGKNPSITELSRCANLSIITLIKSITAREVFRHHPEVKKILWGGEFWSDGYFINTVSKFGDESTISKYVREQGLEKTYKVLQRNLPSFSGGLDTPLLAAG